MDRTELLVVGSGPGGASAALEASAHGVCVTLVDRDARVGGQLVKQTHKFFGWQKKSAGQRGMLIALKLESEIKENPNIELLSGTEVLAYYDDGVVLVEGPSGVNRVLPGKVIIATGASERMLLFPGNDLPGVYGAGAVQTLMNVHGVRPAERVLMVGSGNIGLIVAYQLLQAGVSVSAIVEAAPVIGGYAVHASKIRRMGVPILTSHTVKEALGDDAVRSAVVWELDANWNGVAGTERSLDVDAICLATGLTPLGELLWQAGVQMAYIPELGGFVPVLDRYMETTRQGVFAAGDVAGIEEASTAMAAGRIAGLSAARSLGKVSSDGFDRTFCEYKDELDSLRSGPAAAKVRSGLHAVEQLWDDRKGASK